MKRKLLFVLIVVFVFVSSSCKKDEPQADFILTVEARGVYVLNYGAIVGANYYIDLLLRETAGVGANIENVSFTIFDSYGNSETLTKQGTEVFNSSYIHPNGTLQSNYVIYIGALRLQEGRRIVVKIELLDDNGYHITEEAQASIQW